MADQLEQQQEETKLHSTSYASNDSSLLKKSKLNLREALKENNGMTSHPRVVKAIEELCKLNPTSNPSTSSLLIGDFVTLSAPSFPGRIKSEKENVCMYTLGTIGFGLYEPRNLICTMKSVRQPMTYLNNEETNQKHNETRHDEQKNSGKEEDQDNLAKKDESSSSSQEEEQSHPLSSMKMMYPLVSSITIHTSPGDDDGDLEAILTNQGVCTPVPSSKNSGNGENRLSVTFESGKLTPSKQVLSNKAKLNLWKQTFHKAYTKAHEERSYLSRVGRFALHWMLKLTPPTDLVSNDTDVDNTSTSMLGELYSFQFQMKRAPHGYFDVLFLDEELRITRGNRGTYVIVERM